MDKKVSIIIPVYNVKPQYIKEAIDSALKQTYKNIEIIVVNDGSTNEETVKYLETIDNPLIKVIHQENVGLSETRNIAIRNSSGEYILPLDADDIIAPTYVEKAFNVIESNPKIGIVYCEAEFFGTRTGKWELPEYKFPDILMHNCIFCSALFKKSDWEKTGGYKPEMKYGLEDHEFWLSLIELGVEVYRIPEILFFYRQNQVSRSTEIDDKKMKYLMLQLYNFHKKMYDKNDKYLIFNFKNSFVEQIFSVKNSYNRFYKIVTILGFKFKIKKKFVCEID